MADVEIECFGAREPRPDIVHDDLVRVSRCRRLVFGVHDCRLSRPDYAKVLLGKRSKQEVSNVELGNLAVGQLANQIFRSASLLRRNQKMNSGHMQLECVRPTGWASTCSSGRMKAGP